MNIDPVAYNRKGVDLNNDARALLKLPEAERRAAISRLAKLTSDTVYYSRHFEYKDEMDSSYGPRGALVLLAARGAALIKAGDMATINFSGLTTKDEPYGDWDVQFHRMALTSEDLLKGKPTPAEINLSKLHSDVLKKQISELTNSIAFSIFVDEDFAASLGDKKMKDDSTLNAAAQAGMYLCSSLKRTLVAGESWTTAVLSAIHGAKDAHKWEVKVTRKTMK